MQQRQLQRLYNVDGRKSLKMLNSEIRVAFKLMLKQK